MFKFNRISNKLGAAGALGIIFAAAMVLNQQTTSTSIIAANQNALAQQQISQNAATSEIGVRRMQLALRDMRLARTSEDVGKSLEALTTGKTIADAGLESVLKLAQRPENKERFTKLKSLVEVYAANGHEFAQTQAVYFALIDKRTQASASWNTAMQGVLALPALSESSSRADLTLKLSQAEGMFQDVRAATWRFSSTGESALKQHLTKRSATLLETIAQSRSLANARVLVDAIDTLSSAGKAYIATIDDAIKLEEAKASFIQQRTLPIANQAAELLKTAISVASKLADEATRTAADEITSAGRAGLAMGLIVVLVLFGSILFSFFGVARPLTRLNEALGGMADGKLNIVIPGANRGDEVGDIAKTVVIIRENAEEKARDEAELKENQDKIIVQQRKQDMIRLADDFESAVGEIVETVSSASTELEASASTLTATAERAQELTIMVAAASEEASTNVQSVASATEEMASSVNEISRQVQDSARIASEAVSQAEKTNNRIGLLSDAANKIGDVVELINNIAGQTNLLALNATIEAARAGDAGRGFAVVASEVKALAEQTAKATGEISAQIANMQHATNESVGAIKEISTTIGRMSEISSTIASAVEEQGAATQEISRNVQQAAQGTQQVSSNITDVQRGATETGSASTQVLSAAQSLSLDSNRLKLEVHKFLSTVRAA